jgi:hypothetical protein
LDEKEDGWVKWKTLGLVDEKRGWMSEVETLGLVDEEEDGWMKWKTLQLVVEKEEGCKRKPSSYWMERGWMDASETLPNFWMKRGCMDATENPADL